jgi:hypothetical protein
MTTTTDAPHGRWHGLTYRAPGSDSLYVDYAAQRRIDPDAPLVATHEIVVSAPVARVWAVLADLEGWPAVDPRISHVAVDGAVAEGTRFTWRNGSTRLTSRFAVVDPHHELTWTGEAFGAKVVHRHILTGLEDGRTRLRTEESMSGVSAVVFFGRDKLRAALEGWLAAIARAAEG